MYETLTAREIATLKGLSEMLSQQEAGTLHGVGSTLQGVAEAQVHLARFDAAGRKALEVESLLLRYGKYAPDVQADFLRLRTQFAEADREARSYATDIFQSRWAQRVAVADDFLRKFDSMAQRLTAQAQQAVTGAGGSVNVPTVPLTMDEAGNITSGVTGSFPLVPVLLAVAAGFGVVIFLKRSSTGTAPRAEPIV